MMAMNETTLVGAGGRPSFGIYKSPLHLLNPEDLRPYGEARKPPWPRNALIRFLRLKRWQYMGVCTEDLIFGMAIIDLGYLSNMFCYIFDRSEKTIVEYNILHPFGLNTRIKGSSLAGYTRFTHKDTETSMENEENEIQLKLSIRNECHGDLTFQRYEEPLSIVTRVGRSGFNYTHKEAGIPVRGSLNLKGTSYDITGSNACGVLDYTLGHLLRYTFWNWAAGGGTDEKGRRIGFNLVAGVNDTGFTENVYWIDGRLFKTDVIDFRYDDSNLSAPWRIVSNDGKINLTFHPEGQRKAKTNAGVILSRFHQPFGRFEGTIHEDGLTVPVRQAFGFTEEHEAKW